MAAGKVPPRDPPPLDLAAAALFLDYDGTLVAIAPTPAAAAADAELRGLLGGLDAALGDALALVSGRPVAEIDGFLAPLRLTVAGLHGLDLRLRDGHRLTLAGAGAALGRARRDLGDLQRRTPGTLLEDKRLTVALHYRGAPDAEAAVLALARRLVEGSGGVLQLVPGKMVAELLPAGRDKGRAIADLLDRPACLGRRPVFAGDDVTDEAGFRAVNARGGVSIRVGTSERETAAHHQLADVAAVRRWLRQGLDAARGG